MAPRLKPRVAAVETARFLARIWWIARFAARILEEHAREAEWGTVEQQRVMRRLRQTIRDWRYWEERHR